MTTGFHKRWRLCTRALVCAQRSPGLCSVTHWYAAGASPASVSPAPPSPTPSLPPVPVPTSMQMPLHNAKHVCVCVRLRARLCVFPCTEAKHGTLGVFKSQFEDGRKRCTAMKLSGELVGAVVKLMPFKVFGGKLRSANPSTGNGSKMRRQRHGAHT